MSLCTVANDGGFRDLKALPGGTKKIKPGVSSFSQTPDIIGESLKELWKFLGDNIPKTKQNDTPIFMFATAGLRVLGESVNEKIYDDDDTDDNVILEEDDDDYSKGPVSKILNNLRNYVQENTTFKLLQNDHIRVLTGQEEGLFDYLTVQQLLKLNPYAKIGSENDDDSWSQRIFDPILTKHSNLYPICTVDLGGASTQVAFETDSKKLFTNNITEFTLFPYKVDYPKIFTHSFLDYGINRARELIFSKFISISRSTTVPNPCLFKNKMISFQVDGDDYMLKGSPSFVQCRSGIRDLLLSKPGGNSFIQTEVPDISSEYKVITFDHSYRVASILGLQGFRTLEDFIFNAQTLLDMSWDDAKIAFPSLSDEELEKFPFEAMYVSHLLHEGYGFSKSTSIGFAGSVDGQSLSWAMGALIHNVVELCEQSKL